MGLYICDAGSRWTPRKSSTEIHNKKTYHLAGMFETRYVVARKYSWWRHFLSRCEYHNSLPYYIAISGIILLWLVLVTSVVFEKKSMSAIYNAQTIPQVNLSLLNSEQQIQKQLNHTFQQDHHHIGDRRPPMMCSICGRWYTTYLFDVRGDRDELIR